ncbi:uracil-DNA glycosylase-like protein [Dactylonectria estremocensis]|uniref:Uracil-DNA glycosylase-like protein n=1 Tax=Dactylonectria estremocensis TaxID=1079267 RepID=A0A9P9J4Q5_9HYPO|nr:uracil-DNA glycosylase-like protein [Dactylonectria estremocensis]
MTPNGSDIKKPKADGGIASFFGAAPKPANATPPAKFDKAKRVACLTPEQKTLLKLEIDTLDESWLAHLKDDITAKEFLALKKFLDHSYYNVNQAHGLAFSVRPPTPAPPSLKNVYICLKKDYPSFEVPPNRADLLTPSAEEGVLMLNTCLTVRAHQANSHSNRGWECFTQNVVDVVAHKRTQVVVYMAWGTPAGKRVQKIGRQRLVLGFFDCKHFKLANGWLVNRYGPEGGIDWALVPSNSTKALIREPIATAEAESASREGRESRSEEP